ncbi:MAG TPA: hypothetical protein VGB89_10060 [Bacteroidota bacterium]
MRFGEGDNTYNWIENWAKIPLRGRRPNSESGKSNGRTHGVVVTEAGNIIVFHQANPAVLVFDNNANLLEAWGDRFAGAHGLTLVQENGTEYLWLTDQYSGEVVKTTLDGKTILNIERASHPTYSKSKYAPTWITVHEERFGGNGDVWVTDGYGSHYIHRYDRTGKYLGSINGSEGEAGTFECPHGIWIDYRKSEPELYIADRGNRRFQVYDLQGRFKRVFGADFLTSPCGCVTHEGQLLVPELNARLAVLDEDDRLICYIGENEAVCSHPEWPNVPANLITAGKFNSPHGMAADKQGNLYVVEWIIGGRITKLARC